MAKYYNPHNYAVSFTTKDGGRISLPPVLPGREIKTVEGEYYTNLVERGTLALFTPAVAKANRDAYRQMMMPKKKTRFRAPPPPRMPRRVQVAPPPVQKTEEEFRKEAEEPLKKDEPVVTEETPVEDDVVKFTAEELEEMTVKDLTAVIDANEDFGEPPKKAKKQDLIDFILEKQ